MGSLGIATSGVFIALAAVSPVTAIFFRCALAVPALWLLAQGTSSDGPLSRRPVMVAAIAGVLFAADGLSSTVNAAVLMLVPVGALESAALFLDENPAQL
ncbi:hypothetical protein ACFQ9R_17215 [Nocardia sp. NPDC056541]|uniref:hypothetical protein n=1 Tax=Nocardia sp. NPDC056541 TaxID=3345860 RepID=UPI00367265CA